MSTAVRAAGVNPVDVKSYAGQKKGHDESKLPLRLGVEASGVVTAAGGDARGPAGPVAVGDEVIAYRILGANADTMTVPADAVVPKPPGLAWETASAMMLTGTTAIHLLTAPRAAGGGRRADGDSADPPDSRTAGWRGHHRGHPAGPG